MRKVVASISASLNDRSGALVRRGDVRACDVGGLVGKIPANGRQVWKLLRQPTVGSHGKYE